MSHISSTGMALISTDFPLLASSGLPNTLTTIAEPHVPHRDTSCEAGPSRPHHSLQPDFKSRSCTRSFGVRLKTKVEGMVLRQERETGEPAAKTGGDDSSRTEKDGAAGEGESSREWGVRVGFHT